MGEIGSANRDKMNVALEILERGIAMLHLDPRRDRVAVPARFRGQPVLRLNFAYGFNLPGFEIDEEGMGAVLNFGGERSACWVPWEAVFAITAPEFGQQGRFWPASAPVETHGALEVEEEEQETDEAIRRARRANSRITSSGSGLRLVTSPDAPAPGPSAKQSSGRPSPNDPSPPDAPDPPPGGGSQSGSGVRRLRIVK